MKAATQSQGSAALKIEPLGSEDETAWDAFVDSHARGSIYHRAAWRALITDLFGHETHYLAAKSAEGRIVGVLPLVRLKSWLFGDFLVSMPYFNYGGAVAVDTSVEEALMKAACELAKELASNHIEFRDNRARDAGWPVRTDKVIMGLALPGSKDALWSDLGSKLRAQIKRPAKEGVTVVEGRKELLPDFYKVFARNMRDLGTPVYPQRLFASILETFPEDARIIALRLRDKPVAAGFLLGFRDRLEIPWASSIGEFNRSGVNMRLYWASLEYAITSGYKVFDFGRSTIDSGTYRFKKQWGPRERPLYWHYWLKEGQSIPQLTPSNPKYSLSIKLWQHLPVWITKQLGPKIVGNLP